MHPNWKALSTVDFPRKQFVRPTEPEKTARDLKECSNVGESTGDEVRDFYESVLASEAEDRPIKQEKILNPQQPSKIRNSKFRVKNELSEQLKGEPEDPTAFQKAFFAAQNNDEASASLSRGVCKLIDLSLIFSVLINSCYSSWFQINCTLIISLIYYIAQ